MNFKKKIFVAIQTLVAAGMIAALVAAVLQQVLRNPILLLPGLVRYCSLA